MNLTWLIPALSLTLAAAGVALLAWSLFWDRARGRKRCPKCWYDMAGAVGLVCPECGRDAKRGRGLLRTRRRWRWAGFALTLILAAAALPIVQPVRERGWAAAVPTIVLVRLVPMPAVADMNDEHRLLTSTVWAELERRRRDMHVRHERVLMRRLFDAYSPDTSAFLLTRSEWAADEPVWAQINPQWWMQGPTDRKLILRFSGDSNEMSTKWIHSSSSGVSWADFGWFETLVCIGRADGVVMIEVEALLQEEIWDKGFTKRSTGNDVWSERFTIRLQTVDDADQVVVPFASMEIDSIVHDDMFASIRIDMESKSSTLYVEADWDAVLDSLNAEKNEVVALHVEVERDGELVATGAVGAMHMEMIYRRLAPPVNGVTHMCDMQTVSERLFAPRAAESTWRVRVRGDAATALRCFDAKRYWKGEAELPLTDLRVWHKRERGREQVEEHIEFPIEARR